MARWPTLRWSTARSLLVRSLTARASIARGQTARGIWLAFGLAVAGIALPVGLGKIGVSPNVDAGGSVAGSGAGDAAPSASAMLREVRAAHEGNPLRLARALRLETEGCIAPYASGGRVPPSIAAMMSDMLVVPIGLNAAHLAADGSAPGTQDMLKGGMARFTHDFARMSLDEQVRAGALLDAIETKGEAIARCTIAALHAGIPDLPSI